ncbi:MAG: hypothetical protein ACR2LV_01390 [Solirubrobacteraceae bacterium]
MKFLSPTVTAGLPTPGPLLAAGTDVAGAGVLAAAVVLVVLVVVLDELDELPHAASITASATIAMLARPVLR